MSEVSVACGLYFVPQGWLQGRALLSLNFIDSGESLQWKLIGKSGWHGI